MATLARVVEMDEEACHFGRVVFLRGFFELFSYLRELKALIVKELDILLAPTLLFVNGFIRGKVVSNAHDPSGRSGDGVHLLRSQRLVMPDGKTQIRVFLMYPGLHELSQVPLRQWSRLRNDSSRSHMARMKFIRPYGNTQRKNSQQEP
jgi:hypothetical protein